MVPRIGNQPYARDRRSLARRAENRRPGSQDRRVDASSGLVNDTSHGRVEHPCQQHLQSAAMQSGHLFGRAHRRPEQNACNADVVKRARERTDQIRIADERLRTGGLDLPSVARIARRPARRIAGDGERSTQRAPATPAADDQTPCQDPCFPGSQSATITPPDRRAAATQTGPPNDVTAVRLPQASPGSAHAALASAA